MALTGYLKGISPIKGFLTPQGQLLRGIISSKKVLVGSLAPLKNFSLTGVLSLTKPIVLQGKITLPPEVESLNYQGDYYVTPEPFNDKILQTTGFKLNKNITVLKIPYYKTSNDTGYTVYIGGD